MSRPILYIFAISHYCEKARWALDYLGIDYTLKPVAPGVHAQVAKKLGLKGASLPFLQTGNIVIHGSAAIITWAEEHSSNQKSLTPTKGRAAIEATEKRLDDIMGVHVRRYYYSEALIDQPNTVRPLFTRDIPLLHKLIIRHKWPMITKLMIERMDLGPAQGIESCNIIDRELIWLDGMLSDGRAYLAGNTLSRADITAASLLAPLVAPKEHPTYGGLTLPPHMKKKMNLWQNRPTFQWIRKIYSQHR